VHISDRHNILRSKKLGLKTAVIDGERLRIGQGVEGGATLRLVLEVLRG